MSKKDTLRKKLDTIVFPIATPDTSKPPKTYDKVYLPILEKLGVKTRSDVDALRYAVEDRILEMQKEMQAKALEDLISGKLKDISEAPMYRDNGTIRNVPNHFYHWFAFMAWLNERRTELFK